MSDDSTPPIDTPESGNLLDNLGKKDGMVRKFGGGAATGGDKTTRKFGGMSLECAPGCDHTSHSSMPTLRQKPAEGVKEAVTAAASSEAPVFTHATKKTLGNAWNNFVGDVKSRLKDGIDPHAKAIEHTMNGKTHTHPPVREIDRAGKICIAAGATVSLGIALHGIHNTVRGMTGWEDQELGQSHAPSLTHTLIGAAETLAGVALLKRVLTGTLRVF